MWTTLRRARRRFGGDGAPRPETPDAPGITAEIGSAPVPHPVEDTIIVLGRVEIDRLRHALQEALGDTVETPNSPARIEHALALLLSSAHSPGRARVLRRPAGVSTPESWEIHLEGAEPALGNTVRDAGRTGRFST